MKEQLEVGLVCFAIFTALLVFAVYQGVGEPPSLAPLLYKHRPKGSRAKAKRAWVHTLFADVHTDLLSVASAFVGCCSSLSQRVVAK